MAQYTFLERKISNFLNDFPLLKKNIKIIYQFANCLIYRKKYKLKISNIAKVSRIGKSNHISFWGYYTSSPYRKNRYLYHRLKKRIDPKECNYIDIVINGEKVSETNTWNWQQGCMLTWLDSERFIHNFYAQGFKSKIIDIKTKEEKVINFPIYSISKDGKFALSLNFSRLAKLRPDYGYFNENYKKIEKVDYNDGIFYVDLEKNQAKLIISFKDLLNFHYRKEMENAWHKVNHVDISPNNERFMFLHRWIDDKGRKWSRLITANVDGSSMYLLSDDDMVSHCTWKNSEEIIGWLRKKEIGDRYFLLKDQSEDFSVIGDGILTEDGHPSVSKDEKWLLTDTYPNKARMSKLLLYNLETKKLIELGEFLSPLKYYGEVRCDLHPRFNEDNNKITFDSVHEGMRCLYEMDISNILKGE